MLKSIVSSNGRVIAVALALVLAVVVASGVFLRQTVRAQNDAEAAVRAALTKSTLSFERNDRAMAAEVWAGDEELAGNGCATLTTLTR